MEEWGYNYHKARLVVVDGVKAWQLFHPELMECKYWDKFDLDLEWSAIDLNYKAVVEEWLHMPGIRPPREPISKAKG